MKQESAGRSFFKRFFRNQEDKSEKRTLEEASITGEELLALLNNDAAVSVAEALEVPAFSACVNLISGTVASMPVMLYEEHDGNTEQVQDTRTALINDDTGNLMNGYQFKNAIVRDSLLYGAGYAYINKSGNRVKSLHYVKATDVFIQKNSDPIFRDAVITVNGKRYEEYEFLKLCRHSTDGITGRGLVAELSQLLTAQYKLYRFEKALAKSGGNKKGFLQSEKQLSADAMTALREAWKRLYDSPTPDMLILNNGLKYQDAAQTSVEMQLNELLSEGANEICRALCVPSGLLSGSGNDDMWQMLYKTALAPVIKAFEATLNRDLLLYSERSSKYFAFDTKESLKGDMLKRYQAYEVAARNGFMQIDEIRYAEDLAPLGLGFIKLGLQDVLYDPKTKQIYTPNTDKSATMGESGLQSQDSDDTIGLRENPYHDPDDGQFTSGPGGGSGSAEAASSSSWSTEPASGGSPESNDMSTSAGNPTKDGSTTTSKAESSSDSKDNADSIDHLQDIAYADAVVKRYIDNPKSLGDTTPQEKYDDFIAHGVNVLPLGRGSADGITYEAGGGYRVSGLPDGGCFLYHPEHRSHHNGSYYKLSSGKTGTHRYYMNGDEKYD